MDWTFGYVSLLALLLTLSAGITSVTGNMRYGFIFIALSFIISTLIFLSLNPEKGRKQARAFSEKEPISIESTETNLYLKE